MAAMMVDVISKSPGAGTGDYTVIINCVRNYIVIKLADLGPAKNKFAKNTLGVLMVLYGALFFKSGRKLAHLAP